jgi:hypothetical protein
MGPFRRAALGQQVRGGIPGAGTCAPPKIHGRSRGFEGSGVQAAQDGGAPEVIQADMQGKGVDRLELVLGQRARDKAVEGVRRLAEIIAQQGVCIVRRDRRPRPREAGVAIADQPAPVSLQFGLQAQGLVRPDKVEGGGRDPRIEIHLIHRETRHSPSAHPCKIATGTVPMI